MKKSGALAKGFGLAVILLVAGLFFQGSAQAADNNWSASYWNNKTFSGSPVTQRQEGSINYNWGQNGPNAGVGSDNFSVRWTRSVGFSAGTYRFTATMDDGMRVWVDNSLILDSWYDSQVHSISTDLYLGAGDHSIKVEYYQAGGDAVAVLNWSATGSAPPSTPISNWRGEYFSNRYLTGAPTLVRDDKDISFDWGVGSPEWNVIPADDFSVRWTRTIGFQAGRYRFMVVADDGARLWVNGSLLVDQWHDSINGTYLAEMDLPAGSIPIQMEYYEHVGGAQARLAWANLSSGGTNAWRGEYFNNKNLSGSPALVRDDGQINFNWGSGSPASGTINSDNFSIRWNRSLYFSAGRYRFTVTSDDGVRLWVNNYQIINAWTEHQPLTFSGEIDLGSGTFPVRLEYFEATGGAQVQMTFTAVGSAPPPPPPPPPPPTSGTGTVLAYRLNVRTGPGTQYPVLGQLNRGQVVTLSGYRSADSAWVLIQWSPNTAWVSANPFYIQLSVPVSSLPVWTGTIPGPGDPGSGTATATVVNAYYVNVRSGPGVNYPILTSQRAGTTVTLLGRNAAASWAKIRLASGTVGWMNAYYLRSSTPINSLPVAG